LAEAGGFTVVGTADAWVPRSLEDLAFGTPSEAAAREIAKLQAVRPTGIGSKSEVDPCVSVVDGQCDGDGVHVREARVGDIVAQEALELLADEALHSQVPMSGTFFVASHVAWSEAEARL
jgi:hypothetical protein